MCACRGAHCFSSPVSQLPVCFFCVRAYTLACVPTCMPACDLVPACIPVSSSLPVLCCGQSLDTPVIPTGHGIHDPLFFFWFPTTTLELTLLGCIQNITPTGNFFTCRYISPNLQLPRGYSCLEFSGPQGQFLFVVAQYSIHSSVSMGHCVLEGVFNFAYWPH